MGQRVRRSTAGIATGLAAVLLLSACGSGEDAEKGSTSSASASPSAEPTETETPTETATEASSAPTDQPAAEAQAVDRTHRIGQTRPVQRIDAALDDLFEPAEIRHALAQRRREFRRQGVMRLGRGAYSRHSFSTHATGCR